MKIKLLLGLALSFTLSAFGQRVTVQPINPGGSGNISATNSPAAGKYLTSDGANYYWDLVTASNTNVPPYVITNAQALPFSILSKYTNADTVLFNGNIQIASGAGVNLDNRGRSQLGGPVFASNSITALYTPSNSRPILNSSQQLTNAFKTVFIETNLSPATISNLVASASFGDLIEFGAGDFNMGLVSFGSAPGVRIKGQGIGATRIFGFGSLFTNGPLIKVASSNIIEDMDIIHSVGSAVTCAGIGFNYTRTSADVVDKAATNFVVRRVRMLNWETDSMYFTHTNFFSGRIIDCEGYSKADNLVISGVGTHPGATNWVEVIGCKFYTDNSGNTGGTADSVGIRVTTGNALLMNNDVTATNGPNSYAIKASGTNFSHIYVYNGRYLAAGTNSSYTVDTATTFDPTNVVIYTYGNPFVQADTSAGTKVNVSNGNFTNLVAYGTLTVNGVASLTSINMSGTLDIAASGGILGEYISQGAVPAYWSADGHLIAATGTPDGTKFMRDDGVLATPPGGSASPGGNTGYMQYNKAGAFGGTNQFIFDETNSSLALNTSGVRPNTNIAGLVVSGHVGQASILIHSSGSSNRVFYGGIQSYGVNQDLQLGTLNGITLYVSGTNGALHPDAAFTRDLGLTVAPFGHLYNRTSITEKIFTTLNSNYVANIPGASSTVTMWSSNQHWRVDISTNVTLALGDLLYSNVWYRVRGSNNTSTITYPSTFIWWDGPTESTAPAFQNTKFEFEVMRNNWGTNARVIAERNLALGFTNNVEASTNTTTGVILIGARSVLTNLANIQFAIHRNSTVTLSNLVLSLNTNTHEIVGWTNAVFTNVVTVDNLVNSSTKVYIRPSGVNMTLVWPAFNTAVNGYFWRTNINSPMWTTATNGVVYVLSMEAIGTNLFSTITPW